MRKRFARKRKGFSLVEILVVIGIMAAVAGAGIMIFGGETDRAKFTAAEKELDVLQQAFLQYYNVNGSYKGLKEGKLDAAFDGDNYKNIFQSFISKELTEMKPAESVGTGYHLSISGTPTTMSAVIALYVAPGTAAVHPEQGTVTVGAKTVNVRRNLFSNNTPMIRFIKRGY